MPRKIEIYWLDDGPDSGWVCRIDGSTYEGGGHIAGTEDLGPDDLDDAVAAWLRQRQPLAAPCAACGAAAPERDQIIASMIGEGRSHAEIGAAVDLSERQVTRIAYRLGLSRGRGRPKQIHTP